ncbi:MAG: DUF5011 domain-containing protein [Candidatus Hydrogenedentes bacterium]|nr:DUF5011 domain-containing protein [Candidatus Hydrogenedentota bacterium]
MTILSAAEIAPMKKQVITPGLDGAVGIVPYSVDWLDASGKSLYTGSLDLPIGQRLFLGPDMPCKGLVPKQSVIVVRIEGPAAKANFTSLRLRRSAGKALDYLSPDMPSSLTKHEVVLPVGKIKRIGEKEAPPPGPLSVAKIQDTGSDTNRLVLVILGDGYTAANLSAGSFTTAAQNALTAFGNKSPWDVLFNGTNVYRVDVESNQQGADREDGQNGTLVDTYFNSTFWTSGIDRLLTIDFTGRSRAISAADAYVGVGVWDYLFVLVNSTVYGGSGGSIGVSSIHASASEVIIHEFGHTFAGLADEYTTAYPGYPAGDGEPNVDFDYALANLKWSAWVDTGTPLPTPDTSTYNGVVGAFQGARYLTTGIYRPTRNCLMKALGTAFCPVCKEAHVVDYFDIVSLADTLQPTAGTTVDVPPAGTLVSVSPLSIPGLTYQWSIDGSPLGGATGSSVTVYATDLPTQAATLQLNISYPTSLVRSTSFAENYSWTLNKIGDITAPTAGITLIDSNPTNANAVQFGVQFSENVSPTFTAADIAVAGTLAAGASTAVSGTDPNYVITITPANPTADGTIGITIGSAVSDAAGNPYAGGSSPTVYAIDNAAPTISIGSPSSAITRTGPISYPVAYGNADAVTLSTSDVSLLTTGTATGTVSVSGSGTTTRTVTIASISGNGTLAIAIAAGTASDLAGNMAPAPASSTTFSVDNIAPTATVTLEDANPTNADSVHFGVRFSENVAPTFTAADLTVTGSLASGATTSISGTDPDYTVTVTPANPATDGTIGLTVGSGITDGAGNAYTGGSAPAIYTIENIGPTISIGSPSASVTRSGPVSYAVTYGGADSITLSPSAVSLIATGTASGTISVSGSGTVTRTVTISSIAGNGTLRISIAAGTAADNAANLAPAALASTPFTVDNVAPTAAIALLDPSPTNANAVRFSVQFSENVAPSFSTGDLTVSGTLAIGATVAMTGSDPTYTVTVTPSNPTADGTIGLTIGSGIADSAGNAYAGGSSPSSYTIENVGPSISIGAPSATATRTGAVSYTITYGGADSIGLLASNVSVVSTGTASGTVAVSGSGTIARTVTVSSISGDGTLRISIAPGTASDIAGNLAPSAPSSSPFDVDNTAPTITVNGSLMEYIEVGTPYTDAGATAVDSRDGDITAQITTTGAVNCNVEGAHFLTYNVSDNVGNAAAPVQRTVVVVPPLPDDLPVDTRFVLIALLLVGVAQAGRRIRQSP